MFIGIIAEGKSDLAVITNILRGKSGADGSEVQYLQPESDYDETDLHKMSAEQFSNWALVRETCIQKRKLSDFFSIDEERFIVIQIDTAEAGEIHYDVERPKKRNNHNYSIELRNNVINKINEWLENQFSDQVFYAIAIEEIEAWVLTIYTDKQGDTCRFTNPKEELYRTLNRKFSKKEKKVLSLKDELSKSDKLSRAFRKLKILNKCVAFNESLNLFCESLER
jgi:hypothetical protein